VFYGIENPNATPVPLDNGSCAIKEWLQDKPLQGTIFFLNLPRESEATKKNIRRIIRAKGASISDFFDKRITHVVVDRDNSQDTHAEARTKLSLPFTRPTLLVKESLKQSGGPQNNTNCVEQAKKFGITVVYVSELLHPNFRWCKGINIKTKYVHTWVNGLET
jgi:hypothetical protein